MSRALAARCRGSLSLLLGRAARRSRASSVLAWADVRNGYQHDSISHAVATIERLGRESGAYDTFIRTDSQLITKQPIVFPAGHRHRHRRRVQRPQPELLRRDLLLRRARNRSVTRSSARTCCRSCKDDGKGFVAAHSAATAFFSWPEFGEMLGGRFDEHPVGNRRRHRRRRRPDVSGDAAPAARRVSFTTSSIRSRISRETRSACSRTSTRRSWI